MKKKRYFISYAFIDKNGTKGVDNCNLKIEEKEVTIKKIENEITKQIEAIIVRILYFKELEDYEIFE